MQIVLRLNLNMRKTSLALQIEDTCSSAFDSWVSFTRYIVDKGGYGGNYDPNAAMRDVLWRFSRQSANTRRVSKSSD